MSYPKIHNQNGNGSLNDLDLYDFSDLEALEDAKLLEGLDPTLHPIFNQKTPKYYTITPLQTLGAIFLSAFVMYILSVIIIAMWNGGARGG